MTTELAQTLGLTLYKLCCLGVGTALCYMGYRLFLQGITTSAGDLDATIQGHRVMLRRAAPGTFFAVLGAAVLVATIWRGLEFKEEIRPAPSVQAKPNIAE